MTTGPASPTAFAGPRAPDPNAPPPLHTLARRPQVVAALLIHTAAASLRVTSALVHAAETALGTICPDAGLMRLCAGFHDAEARCEAAPDDTNEWQVWLSRRWGFSDAIEATTPRTAAGHHAKARVALVLMQEAADTANEYERFVLATLRDLVGSAAA